MVENVILVDAYDNPIGTAEKFTAHQNGGKLHRAISVFIFSSQGKLLLQRRAAEKYHCPGLRSNTCCSHPRPGEISLDAAQRRLQEEMGMSCPLHEKFTFTYRAEFDNGLTEHEFDHVFVGVSDAEPILNPEEADERQYISPADLLEAIKKNRSAFSPRLCIVMEEYYDSLIVLGD